MVAWKLIHFWSIRWYHFGATFHALYTDFPYIRLLFKMGFPHSLKTDEMVHYIVENFEWYHRGVSFPPLPLPSDYEDLGQDFDLAVAQEVARDFELPDMP